MSVQLIAGMDRQRSHAKTSTADWGCLAACFRRSMLNILSNRR